MRANHTRFDKQDDAFTDDGYPYDDEAPYCHTCNNSGVVVTCCDDLCANTDHCIHGDGEMDCPDCDG